MTTATGSMTTGPWVATSSSSATRSTSSSTWCRRRSARAFTREAPDAPMSMSVAVAWRSDAVAAVCKGAPWVRLAAMPRLRSSSRSSGGGGKYSSSSVVCTTSTPRAGARRSRRSWISQSGADAPAVTPTTPLRSLGTSPGELTRSTRGTPPRSPPSRARRCSTSWPSRARPWRHSVAPLPSRPLGGWSSRSRGPNAPASRCPGSARGRA